MAYSEGLPTVYDLFELRKHSEDDIAKAANSVITLVCALSDERIQEIVRSSRKGRKPKKRESMQRIRDAFVTVRGYEEVDSDISLASVLPHWDVPLDCTSTDLLRNNCSSDYITGCIDLVRRTLRWDQQETKRALNRENHLDRRREFRARKY